MHLRGERRLAEAEGKISDAVKCEQLAIDVTARCALGCTRQRACFALGQLELDDRAGNIPRHVLAANQIVRRMMVERVCLEQPAVRQAQPFVAVETIVDTYAHHALRQGVYARRPMSERSDGCISERKADVAPAHLEQLRKRLARRNLKLQVSSDAKKLLAEEGYDPAFGARPLRRVIQQRIENPLATRILKGEFAEGDTIYVDVDTSRHDFVFNKKRETVEAELVS